MNEDLSGHVAVVVSQDPNIAMVGWGMSSPDCLARTCGLGCTSSVRANEAPSRLMLV
jgi:hypothetical protein